MQSKGYFAQMSGLLPDDDSKIEELVEILGFGIENGNAIWIIGNGGSASTADHFEVDLSYVRNYLDKQAVMATSLCSNSSLITAIANDIGFEHTFSHQLMRRAKPGDICFAISASGNSPNLIKALQYCSENGITKIALLGFDGGEMREMCDVHLLIPTETGLYGPVEDVHLSVCHLIAARLRDRLFSKDPS